MNETLQGLLVSMDNAGRKMGITFTIYQESHIYTLKLHCKANTMTLIITKNYDELRGYMQGYAESLEMATSVLDAMAGGATS